MIKLRVTTHSGEDDIVEVAEYNAQAFADELNDNAIQSVVLGENIYSRIDVKNVKPFVEDGAITEDSDIKP